MVEFHISSIINTQDKSLSNKVVRVMPLEWKRRWCWVNDIKSRKYGGVWLLIGKLNLLQFE